MEKNGVGVRKGAWTKEEDTLLKNCIEKFGEGKWHKVPPRAGLNRCRKSCRLRWLNYLRPNLKRGYFTNDEIDLIQRLHKLLGNRWSLIAGRLPGRTANDVKNFWNTHILKKKSSSSLSSSSSSSLAGEKTKEIKTFTEKNITIKPRPRSFSKSHVPIHSNEEVINKTNETSAPLMCRQDDWKNTSVEFSLINNVLSEKEVDECIRWWLETPGDDGGDEQIPVSFSDKVREGDGAFMEPLFSPRQINQKVTEFSSVSFDVDAFDHLTSFD